MVGGVKVRRKRKRAVTIAVAGVVDRWCNHPSRPANCVEIDHEITSLTGRGNVSLVHEIPRAPFFPFAILECSSTLFLIATESLSLQSMT